MDQASAAQRTLLLQGLRQGFLDGRVDSAIADAELSHEAGLRTQLDVLDLWTASGETVGGWKVGFTSGPARDRMGVGFRPFGYVLGSRVMRSGIVLDLGGLSDLEIEPELAFRIDRRLTGTVGRGEVVDAISYAAPAFELQQMRLESGVSEGMVIANDLGNWGIVLGEPRRWTGPVRDVAVTLSCDGRFVASGGPDYEIDDPIDSIRTLCHGLAAFDRGLRPGQWVITGAFARVPVSDPGRWEASFSSVGDVQVQFA